VRELTISQFEYAPPLLIRRKPQEVDPARVASARAKVDEHLARLETELKGRAWFGGEIFSLADAALVPPVMMTLPLLGVLPDSRYPNIASWSRRVAERPSSSAKRTIRGG